MLHVISPTRRVPVLSLMKMWDPAQGVYDEDILVPQLSWTPNVQYHMKWDNKSSKGEGCAALRCNPRRLHS
jgi:hypothetical protein